MDICNNWGEGSGLEIWDVSCESPEEIDFENYGEGAEQYHQQFLSFDTTVNLVVLVITMVVLISVVAALCR